MALKSLSDVAEHYRYGEDTLAPSPTLVVLSSDCELVPFRFLKTDQTDPLPFIKAPIPMPEKPAAAAPAGMLIQMSQCARVRVSIAGFCATK